MDADSAPRVRPPQTAAGRPLASDAEHHPTTHDPPPSGPPTASPRIGPRRTPLRHRHAGVSIMTSERFSLSLTLIPLATALGLFVGSFLNVVIYRAPRGLSVSTPRSFCPTCDRQLLWWENVPVVSWAALRGRCRTCHQPISIRYPLVEGVTGATFAVIDLGSARDGHRLRLLRDGIRPHRVGPHRVRRSARAVLVGRHRHRTGPVHHHRGWTDGSIGGRSSVGSLIGTALALGVVGLLHRGDPTGADPRGHGRGRAAHLGCWAGDSGWLPARRELFWNRGLLRLLGCRTGGGAANSAHRWIPSGAPAIHSPGSGDPSGHGHRGGDGRLTGGRRVRVR